MESRLNIWSYPPHQAPPRADRLPLQTLLTGSAFAVLFICVGTDVFSILLGEANAGLVARLKLLCYLGIAMLGLLFHRTLLAGCFHAPLLVGLLAFTTASVLWSVDASETAERLVALLSCTGLGLLLGTALSLRSLVLFIATLGAGVAILSLVAIATVPAARGAPPWEDVWRGIFNHKNGLGAACAIFLPFLAHTALVSRGKFRHFFALCAMSCLVLLAGSYSRTAQLVSVIALINLALGLLMRGRQLTWIAVTMMALLGTGSVVALLFATGLTDSIFAALDRKSTMSGRLPIWQLVWPWVEARPILGYGYAAFWDPESRRIMDIARDPTLNFTPFYSHNGLLETLLAIGSVGFGLFLLVYARAIRALATVALARQGVVDLAPLLVFLLSFTLLNISESSILTRDDLVWILFVAVTARLAALENTAKHMNRGSIGPDSGVGAIRSPRRGA